MPYVAKPYSHEVFDGLRDLHETHREFRERGIAQEAMMDVREIFHKYGVADRLGLLILHRHFPMAPNERLVEYGPVSTPWVVNSEDNVLGGRIVPKCWAFKNGDLYPTEYGFNPSSQPSYDDVNFDEEFVRALGGVLEREGLTDIFGLTVLEDQGAGNLKGMHSMDDSLSVERTNGRVSIMLPVSAEEREARAREKGNAEEVAWSFGCAKAMWDSEILPARICWVCEECE